MLQLNKKNEIYIVTVKIAVAASVLSFVEKFKHGCLKTKKISFLLLSLQN